MAKPYRCDNCFNYFNPLEMMHYRKSPWELPKIKKGRRGSVCNPCFEDLSKSN